jgi:hypothetical protein
MSAKKTINNFKSTIKDLLARDLLDHIFVSMNFEPIQKSPKYLSWIDAKLIVFVNDYVFKHKLLDSAFVKTMNKAFSTTRFEILLKRFLVEYLLQLFAKLYDFSCGKNVLYQNIVLEDNPLNRFAVTEYSREFSVSLNVKWSSPQNSFLKLIRMALLVKSVVVISLKNGLKFSGRIENYKVMRESIWGLDDSGEKLFCDDFLVDGDKIRKQDIIFFSRGPHTDDGRQKAYRDAQKYGYAHFDLCKLSLTLKAFVTRVISKYIILGSKALLCDLNGSNFSLFSSIFSYFANFGLPYEKVFSNYKIGAELGHSYFSPYHIVESIICQSFGAKYYLMHWSDMSININNHIVAFLGCDKYLVWGDAHIKGVEGGSELFCHTGYVFKRFILEIKSRRNKILSDANVDVKGKVISFFDESFGGEVKMVEEHFVNFWEMALKLALKEKDNTIIIKPKELSRYLKLSDHQMKHFLEIKTQLELLPNSHIITQWSFIEGIGVSDIVVTQGMASSATIAIICGIDGFYLDQVDYDHPFSKLFKDKIVFDDSDKLINMIQEVIKGGASPLKDISPELLRRYDHYGDDRGIDLFRTILSGENNIRGS